MKNLISIYVLFLVFATFIYPAVSEDDARLKSLILLENFDKISSGELPKGWWVEGGQKVGVELGRLHIQADPINGPGKVCTVWTDFVISGDTQINYDAHVLSSIKNANNINLFLYYSDPSGRNLYLTRANRHDARYVLYHHLDGYIITFLNLKGQGRIRIRRCPGFKLLNERFGYHCRKGKTYHITITKKNGTITCDIDNGKFSLSAQDQMSYNKGRIGFRTWATDYWVDNLKVVSLR